MTSDRLRPWSDRLSAVDDLAPGATVVVGCSGGADSLALLALARARDLRVVAVYVDHGLRAGTDREAGIVRAAAAAVGADARVVAVEIDPSANLEARARDARYDALSAAATDVGSGVVLVGHTRDDQAETVLLGLMRGSGTAGLAGMAAARTTGTGVVVRRPLLRLRRADTVEICALLRFEPVRDPMNDDRRHRRVWLRREVIPRLERGADRDLVDVLARQADVLREDNELLDALAAGHAGDDAAVLRELPRALARRVVRGWLGSPPPSLATVDAVLQVASGDRRAAEIPGGRRVERAGDRLHLLDAVDGREPEPERVALALPGRARFGPVEVEAWIEEAPPVAWPDGARLAVVDADLAGGQASIRIALAAERFRPLGRGGSKLVRGALAEAGVPAAKRERAPIVVAGPGAAVAADSALWVVGYRVDDRVRVSSRTRRYLWLSVNPC